MSGTVIGTLRSTVLLLLLVNASVNAMPKCNGVESDCNIQVNFTGRFEMETCEISIDNRSANETVTLPTVSSDSLQKSDDEAGSKSFQVILKKCPGAVTVGVHFVSVASTKLDLATGNLLNSTASGMSANTQLRLRNETGVKMVPDDSASVQDYIIPQNGGDVSHTFFVSYYANAPVTEGDVSASAGIEMIYK